MEESEVKNDLSHQNPAEKAAMEDCDRIEVIEDLIEASHKAKEESHKTDEEIKVE